MLRALLFAGIMIPGLWAALRSRYAALLLYFWFAFFRPQEWVWVDVSSLQLSLVLGLLVVVPSLLSGILPNLTHPLSVGSLVFFLAACGAQLGAVDPSVSGYWLNYLFKLLLMSLFATSLLTERRRYLTALMVVAVSFGFHAAKSGLASLLV